MALTPSVDLSAASWITGSDQPWQDLAGFGPSGFAAYARLRFLPDPAYQGQSENDNDFADDAPSETARLQAALEVLARHTRTPDDCYFCLWDGWGWTVAGAPGAWSITMEQAGAGSTPQEPMPSSALPGGAVPARLPSRRDRPEARSTPQAPKVAIPNRAYFLFHGSVSDLGDWGTVEKEPGGFTPHMPDPAFIWPADHAWCLANDVDPHWAGIGASTAAIDQLMTEPHLDVVPADPSHDQPSYS